MAARWRRSAAWVAALWVLGSGRAVAGPPDDGWRGERDDVPPAVLDAARAVRTRPGEIPRLRAATDGETLELPLKHTHYFAEVSGFVARVEVIQTYTNPLDRAIEAVYVFPLPENAAVDDMKIRVGDRVIVAEIRERRAARRVYEQARAAGHTAALLEQERPNVFTQSVANIAPGAEIDVHLRYVQPLTYDAGEYELVAPLVVGPRFIPGAPTGTRRGLGGRADTDEVPDASRITPPILGRGMRSGHDVSIEVVIEPGLPLVDLDAPTHAVEAFETDDGRVQVNLVDADAIPNRDFVLRWRVDGEAPRAAVLTHRAGETGYFALVVQPPRLDVESLVGRREVYFVVDVSGSMWGVPLAQCKAAVRAALERLRPVDTFNVFTFAGRTGRLFDRPVPADRAGIDAALKFVDGLRAGGGTMMAGAVEAALSPDVEPGRHRYVFFLTDGYVGNEAAIFAGARDLVASIERRGRRARVFGLGVGSSVNRHLIDGLSRAGRGVPFYLGHRERPDRAIDAFFRTIDHPVLTDVKIDWGDLPVEDVEPARVPDLFATRPLLLHGRYRRPAKGTIRIRGRSAGRRLALEVPVELPAVAERNGALASLWARARVASLEPRVWAGSDRAAVEAITALGLEHRLVTAYTSFVAVDRSRVVSDGSPRTLVQPVEAPEAVDPVRAGGLGYGAGIYKAMGSQLVGPDGSRGGAGFGGALNAAMSGGGEELVVGKGGSDGFVVTGHGRGGGGVGRGRLVGRSDRGGGVPGFAEERRPRLRAGEVVARGALAPDAALRQLRKHRPALRACHERALRSRPGLAGRLTLELVFGPDGRVKSAAIQRSTLADDAMEACVLGVARRVRLPAPISNETKLVIPLHFRLPGEQKTP